MAKISGSSLLGIKSPMTVGPTQFPGLLVSAKGAKGAMSVAYGQAPSTTASTIEPLTVLDRITVQVPFGSVACALAAQRAMR